MGRARNLATVAIAVGLVALSEVAGIRLAESGRWVAAAVYVLIIPFGTLVEWHAARRRGQEAGETADRLVPMIALAVGAALL